MGEINRDSVNTTVTFEIASVTPSSAVIRRGDTEYVAGLSGSTAYVPYDITRLDGKFEIEWTYYIDGSTYTKVDTHEVVSRLFDRQSLESWDSDFKMLDDAAINRLEKIIRGVIERVTGQKFIYEYDTVVVRGSGGSVQSLPKRLVKADSFNDRTGDLLDNFIYPTNDGWSLITNDAPRWVDNFYSSNPIENPWRKTGYFRDDTDYAISGYFGYPSIPTDITTAALILAEDYGCDESLWRDRYVDNIRAADWRFQFDKRVWNATGNVKADQLLEKYTLGRMVIL